jgi:branched-chain amino acid transport system ATP-binding protein
MVQHLEGIIGELKRAGLAILLVEQNLYSALAVADRLYVMETGRIVHEASAAEARREEGPLLRFLGVH